MQQIMEAANAASPPVRQQVIQKLQERQLLALAQVLPGSLGARARERGGLLTRELRALHARLTGEAAAGAPPVPGPPSGGDRQLARRAAALAGALRPTLETTGATRHPTTSGAGRTVPADAVRRPWLWEALAPAVGRAWLDETPALDDELAEKLGTPPARAAGSAAHRYAAHLAQAWRAELFADAAALCLIGSAHGAALLRQGLEAPADSRVRAWLDANGNPRPTPPWHARVILACQVLEQLGLTEAALALESRWRAELPDGRVLVLRGPGGAADLPLAAVEDQIEHAARELARERWLTLGNRPLSQVPGLDHAFDLGRDVGGLQVRLRDGRTVTGESPRALLATLASWPQGPPVSDEAAEAIAQSLDELAKRSAPAAETPTPRRPRPIRPGSRRRVVRQALVVGELLGHHDRG